MFVLIFLALVSSSQQYRQHDKYSSEDNVAMETEEGLYHSPSDYDSHNTYTVLEADEPNYPKVFKSQFHSGNDPETMEKRRLKYFENEYNQDKYQSATNHHDVRPNVDNQSNGWRPSRSNDDMRHKFILAQDPMLLENIIKDGDDGRILGFKSYVEHFSDDENSPEMREAVKQGSLEDIKRLVPKSGMTIEFYHSKENGVGLPEEDKRQTKLESNNLQQLSSNFKSVPFRNYNAEYKLNREEYRQHKPKSSVRIKKKPTHDLPENLPLTLEGSDSKWHSFENPQIDTSLFQQKKQYSGSVRLPFALPNQNEKRKPLFESHAQHTAPGSHGQTSSKENFQSQLRYEPKPTASYSETLFSNSLTFDKDTTGQGNVFRPEKYHQQQQQKALEAAVTKKPFYVFRQTTPSSNAFATPKPLSTLLPEFAEHFSHFTTPAPYRAPAEQHTKTSVDDFWKNQQFSPLTSTGIGYSGKLQETNPYPSIHYNNEVTPLKNNRFFPEQPKPTSQTSEKDLKIKLIKQKQKELAELTSQLSVEMFKKPKYEYQQLPSTTELPTFNQIGLLPSYENFQDVILNTGNTETRHGEKQLMYDITLQPSFRPLKREAPKLSKNGFRPQTSVDIVPSKSRTRQDQYKDVFLKSHKTSHEFPQNTDVMDFQVGASYRFNRRSKENTGPGVNRRHHTKTEGQKKQKNRR